MLFEFGKIESSQGCIEMKIQRLLLAGLTITKPRELLSITKDELDLKAGFVIFVQTEWSERWIGRKEQRHSLFVRMTLVNQINDANFAFE